MRNCSSDAALRRGRVGVISAALAASALALAAPARGGEVRFQAGVATFGNLTNEELVDELTELGRRPQERHILLQTRRPLTSDERVAMAEAGINLLSPLGDNAWFARLADTFDGGRRAAALDVLADVSAIDVSWKMHPHFMDHGVPTWVVVDEGQPVVTPGGRAIPNPVVAVYVAFHPGVKLVPEGWMLAAMHGAKVRSELKSVNGLVLEIPYLSIEPFAASDQVQWIEPALPPFSELNDSNRDRVGADVAQELPYGLDGSGVNVLVYDSGYGLASHQDFGGRLTARDTSGLRDHSTHVAGTVGGSGAASGGLYRGMAPGVTIESYGFEQEGGLQEGFLYSDPGDLEADYDEAINVYNVDISNNSIGTNTATNGFPCEWEGNYGITSALIDSIVRGSLGSPFRIVWANGNERQTSACQGQEGFPPPYHTTAPPACAKNHIAVGALNSNDDSMTSFSSWGPSDDGRLKPDISAPGCQSNDDFDVTSCSSSGGYTGKCGTSMASPTVCGISALILQDYRLQYPGAPDFRNSTLKTLLAHTAVDLGNPGPDYQFGYGSVRVIPAVDHMRAGNFIEAELDQGQTYSVLVTVNPADTEFKVTIAWDDVAATPNVSPSLVNDLDLRVYDPQGVEHFVWTLDPQNPADPAVQTVTDHLNNIEQVYIADPMPGVYRVDVVGNNVPVGPQVFSLAASPVLINCSSRGITTSDSPVYACNSTATLRVVDCDLNTNDEIVETVEVTVTSDSAPQGRTVLLTETGPETSAFEGQILLTTSAGTGSPASGPALGGLSGPSSTKYAGGLRIAHGDTVITTYIDADDGEGGQNVEVSSIATVDCEAPMIVSVTTTNIEPRSATVVVNSSEPVRATVHYGLDCDQLLQTASSLAYNTTVEIDLANLEDNTTYYLAVDIEDQAGNAMSFSNNGNCYTFTTPEVPDFFTEQFSGSFDLDGLSITYTPNGTIDHYAACVEPIVTLPTDPAGGASLPLSDDDSEPVNVAGNTVEIYGLPFSTFYVGSNGYVTFGATDTDYTETLDEHFAAPPRVSALWDDLNPSSGGSVSWKQLGDRMAVTWQGVPEFSTSNSNTFQIELFFDGTIRVSWLGIDTSDCLVGLSEGVGISPDFLENDLSAFGGCGPRPPVALDLNVEAIEGVNEAIVLLATDDGLPDPPGALTYVVTSLPLRDLRDAGTMQLITAGDLPYTIAGGGNELIYEPGTGFLGSDSFTFIADDGGTPPEGGPSGPGTVSITVNGQQLVYSFPLDTPESWSTTGQWEWGQPTGGGSHSGDPVSGATGASVYGFNLLGDYDNDLAQTYYLTTRAINCSNVSGTELRFWRWLGIEAAPNDFANVQVSNNGTTWVTVWEHTGGAIDESAWSLQTYDISAVADGQPAVYLRWGMGPTNESVTYPGWNIDDVEIHGIVPLSSSAPEGGGFVAAQQIVEILAAWGCRDCPADVTGDGLVDVDDLIAAVTTGAAGPAAPRATSAGPGASVADEPQIQVADGGAFVNDGLLAPAVYGGVVNVRQAFRQTARAALDVEIGGPRPVDDHDLVVIDGPATLDGLLRVRFTGEFRPQVGDHFTVLLARAIAGDFALAEVPTIPDGVVEIVVDGQAVTVCVTDGDCTNLVGALDLGADLDADGVVDVTDVQILLHEWGADPSVGDLDGDGAVDGRDLRRALEAR